MFVLMVCVFIFFFNDTATTEIYTLSLHDALPISELAPRTQQWTASKFQCGIKFRDRKSTRLNSSHMSISYAVFCLKKKKIRREVDYDGGQKQMIKKFRGYGYRFVETVATLLAPIATRPSRQEPPSPPFFFFNDTATTEIYTLSLHDALPI